MKYRPRTFLVELVMIAVAIGFLFPVYVLVTLAFKDPQQIANRPLSLIHHMWSPTRASSLSVHVISSPVTSWTRSIASSTETLLCRPPPML